MRGRTVITLNYDEALETAVGAAGYTFQVDCGPYPFENLNDAGAAAALRLVKLHGSVTWRRSANDGEVVEMDPIEHGQFVNREMRHAGRDTPEVIFGDGNKLRADGPFLDLYAESLTALDQARKLVVIGYSFRDAHVNEAIRRWYNAQDSGAVLRIARRTKELPDVLQGWHLNPDSLHIQVYDGQGSEAMESILKWPGLLS